MTRDLPTIVPRGTRRWIARPLLAAAPLALALGCGSTAPTADSETITVAGGTFTMGSDADCSDSAGLVCTGDRPPHQVRVSSFVMDDTEVTKAQYAKCVSDGICSAVGAYYAEQDDSPVLVDDPDSARKYCAGRKMPMRLPTEAEFEFATRVQPGGGVQTYSWGDEPPSCERIPMAGCPEQVARPTGKSPGDVSPWGVHDLSGNVPEWVGDSYSPFAGCSDHVGYGEMCWGAGAGCADARCALDGQFCNSACLPPPATANPATMASASPVCLKAPASALLIDPIMQGSSPFTVVRGGSPVDNACAFAGFTRRYAAAKSFAAGFRCARSADMTDRKGTATYRFAIKGCPQQNGRVRVEIKIPGGGGVGYKLDAYSPRAAGFAESMPDDTGVVASVPCDATMVVYPSGVTALEINLSTVGNPNCLGATQMVTLMPNQDTPAEGVDAISLTPSNNCL